MGTGPQGELRFEFDPSETRYSVSDILPESVRAEIIEDPGGATFESMVEMLGGIDGTVVDQVGQCHDVSMRKWLNVEDSGLRFVLTVKYQIREDKRRLPNGESWI